MRKLFFLLILLSWPSIIIASFPNPYTLDEKAQVIFGDSTVVGSYQGLENYATNYVNSYLHITFTYTHHRCCTASFPPRLYVTAVDPRATTTPTARDSSTVHEFPSIMSDPSTLTDWYSFDVQFDATGYAAVVKQGGATTTISFHKDISGITNADWAALANLFPRQSPINNNSMSFTPLPIYQAPVPVVATTTPVIIVPGIMGSKLLEDNPVDNLIWPNTIQIVASISDDFLDFLKMDTDGNSINTNVITGTILKTLNDTDYFDGLFNSLSTSGYEENVDLFENPYDWRLDILKIASDIEANAVLSLKEKIDQIKTERGVTKVNLVAHSMGGLLVKKYLKDYGGDSVEKFIDIGTPHNGSPSAYKILMHGDNLGVSKFLGLININGNRIKEISQNMPAVYQLLPSQKYFETADSNYYVFDGVNNSQRLNFSQTKEHMASQGRNSALVERADAFHQEIDNLDPATYGVDTYNFVGCGTPTIGQFYLLEGGDHPIYNIKMINGDGTVPLKSAEAMNALKTYYVKNAQHALMSSTSGVKDLIAEILTSTSTEFDISPYSNLALSADNCAIPNGKIVSFHSPIELHVYDSSGNHTGPDTNGDIENELSGVIYEVIGDNKFAFLPAGTEYTIKGNATAAGTLDTRIQEIVSGEVATTTLWTDVALTSTTQVQFSINSNTPMQIELDNDNDGTYEILVNISTSVAGILESTGKVASVASTQVASSASARPAEASPEPVLGTAISTLEITEATSTPIVLHVAAPTAQPAEPLNLELSPKSLPARLGPAGGEPTSYDNTAVVYKSFGYKLTGLFKTIWFWIKSKL